jgi:hypothetical protein
LPVDSAVSPNFFTISASPGTKLRKLTHKLCGLADINKKLGKYLTDNTAYFIELSWHELYSMCPILVLL